MEIYCQFRIFGVFCRIKVHFLVYFGVFCSWFYLFLQRCKICKKDFANVYRLQRHMISHDESANLRRFKCADCGKAFKFKHHLKVSLAFKKICFCKRISIWSKKGKADLWKDSGSRLSHFWGVEIDELSL